MNVHPFTFDRAGFVGSEGQLGTAAGSSPSDESPTVKRPAPAEATAGSRGRAPKAASSSPPQYPDPPEPAAYQGLLGKIVRLVEPHTEADPMAILVQLLVAFGNLIGRGPHFEAEADKHHTNLFVGLVGVTSKGRKGTSWGIVRRLLEPLDGAWVRDRIKSGLSSGEGLVWAIRDDAGAAREEDAEEDVAVQRDQRLLVLEQELASTIRVLGREGNTLSAMVRQSWDTGMLSTLTKNNPAKATDAHVSIVGHVTRDELRRYLDRTEAGNGFANRFVWLCVKRSKALPEGGQLNRVNLGPVVNALANAAEHARTLGFKVLARDHEARELWCELYGPLSEGRPGLLGAVTSRAEAQVMRLALVYALLDCSTEIKVEHLRAALALWRYSENSAKFIFGEALGDPLADELLNMIRRSPAGLTRTEIVNAFGRHKAGADLDRPLSVLVEYGLIRSTQVTTGGRPAERWISICEISDQSGERQTGSDLSSLPSLSSQPPSLVQPEEDSL